MGIFRVEALRLNEISSAPINKLLGLVSFWTPHIKWKCKDKQKEKAE